MYMYLIDPITTLILVLRNLNMLRIRVVYKAGCVQIVAKIHSFGSFLHVFKNRIGTKSTFKDARSVS